MVRKDSSCPHPQQAILWSEIDIPPKVNHTLPLHATRIHGDFSRSFPYFSSQPLTLDIIWPNLDISTPAQSKTASNSQWLDLFANTYRSASPFTGLLNVVHRSTGIKSAFVWMGSPNLCLTCCFCSLMSYWECSTAPDSNYDCSISSYYYSQKVAVITVTSWWCQAQAAMQVPLPNGVIIIDPSQTAPQFFISTTSHKNLWVFQLASAASHYLSYYS